MNAFGFVLGLAALAALVVVPLMVLSRLRRARQADAERDDEAWLLRPSPAAHWAAAFCLIPWLGVLMRWQMGQQEPDYAITNTGPAMGLGLAVVGTAVAIWLVWRHRRRTIRFDGDGIMTVRHRLDWDELAEAGFAPRDPTVLLLVFRDGERIRVTADMQGRRRLMDHVRRLCQRQGLAYHGRRGTRRGTDA